MVDSKKSSIKIFFFFFYEETYGLLIFIFDRINLNADLSSFP